jgi:hypothetical protein
MELLTNLTETIYTLSTGSQSTFALHTTMAVEKGSGTETLKSKIHKMSAGDAWTGAKHCQGKVTSIHFIRGLF